MWIQPFSATPPSPAAPASASISARPKRLRGGIQPTTSAPAAPSPDNNQHAALHGALASRFVDRALRISAAADLMAARTRG